MAYNYLNYSSLLMLVGLKHIPQSTDIKSLICKGKSERLRIVPWGTSEAESANEDALFLLIYFLLWHCHLHESMQ